MKNTLLILLAITMQYNIIAQNLVPNHSFETYDTCPNDASQLMYALPWIEPTQGTPDYFNSCFTGGPIPVGVPLNYAGFKVPKDGNGYSAISLYYNYPGGYREYIKVKLLDTLSFGQSYHVHFFLSLCDSSNFATDEVGLFFTSDTSFYPIYDTLPFNPQIKNISGNILNNRSIWYEISGNYIANGNETYLIIGNFNGDGNTSLLSVPGGSLSNADNDASYYYIDDVCVSTDSTTCGIELNVIENNNNVINFNVFPNPATENIFINYNGPRQVFDVFIYDISGYKVRSTSIYVDQVNLNGLASGLYMFEFRNKEYQFFKKVTIK